MKKPKYACEMKMCMKTKNGKKRRERAFLYLFMPFPSLSKRGEYKSYDSNMNQNHGEGKKIIAPRDTE